METCSIPPYTAHVAEVILVACERGAGSLKRPVLQVWSKAGDLLAEHDSIHADPIYPACYLRDRIDEAWLRTFGQKAVPSCQPIPEQEAANA